MVVRKAEKRDELQAEADGLAAELETMIATNATLSAINRQRRLVEERQSLVDEMTDIVDDMIEFKWYRVEQNAVRYCEWLTDNSPGGAGSVLANSSARVGKLLRTSW